MKTEDFIAMLAKEGAKKPLPTPSKSTFKWLLIITFYFGGLVVFHDFRADISKKLSEPIYITEIITMLATAILAAWSASWLSLPDTHPKSWVRFLPLLPLLLLVGILFYCILTANSLSLSECLKLGRYDRIIRIIAYSLFPGIVIFHTIQKGAPVRCSWAGTMAGLSVSSFGYILLRLVDQSDDPTQLLIWHFFPVLLVTIIGTTLGKVYLGRAWQQI